MKKALCLALFAAVASAAEHNLEAPDPAADCDAEKAKVAALHIAIDDKYFHDSSPVIDRQIAKAGNRLAALLNRTLPR